MSSTATATQTPATESAPAGSLEHLRNQIASAFRAQFPERQPDGTYRYHYIAATYADHIIVCIDQSTGETYYRYDYEITDVTSVGAEPTSIVTFGDPQPVELRYVAADVVAEASRLRIERVTQPRQDLRETRDLSEAATTGDGSTITLTVIKAGLNRAGSRYYTEAALQGGVSLFRGLKMYANHQTRAEEQARPEGDVWQWVASVTETAYDSATKSIRATAKLIDPTFKAKVQALAEAGLLDTLGVSIRAVGSGQQATVEGVNTFRVDEFDGALSVDFVTEPGAGGRVELLESATEPGVHALTLTQLRERRPDLVAAVLTEATKQTKEAGVADITQEMLDAEKRRADEAERKAREAEEAKAVAESAVESIKAEQAKAAAQESIGKAIAEANLPESGQKYLRESLAEVTDIEQAKAAITRFKETVESMGGVKSPVTGNGSASGSTQAAVSLEESFTGILGDPEQAKVAASVGR